MAEHWRSGYDDAMRTLRHPEVLERAGTATRSPSSTFAGDGN
jgi:NTE family protein